MAELGSNAVGKALTTSRKKRPSRSSCRSHTDSDYLSSSWISKTPIGKKSKTVKERNKHVLLLTHEHINLSVQMDSRTLKVQVYGSVIRADS